jgi:hypothetical protein
MNQATIAQQVKAFIGVCDVILELIEKRERLGMPSGELYAVVMGHMDIDQYTTLIDIMVRSGRIVQRNHCLYGRDYA